MFQPIPDAWKKSVCKILLAGDQRSIIVKKTTALIPWQDTFPNAFIYDLYGALADSLMQPSICGEKKTMDEDGIAYAFHFTYETRRLFAKVLLSPDEKVIIIYSAHRDT
jgi:hypothetical protein